MEDVYGELVSVKDELEKLKAEYQIKMELFENLKKAHSKQSLKFEEAKEKIDKQSQELKVKYEEIADARQLSKMIESSLQEKELSLRNLCSLSEKAKADLEQKLKTMEGENRDLVSILDEVTTRNKELELHVCANRKQIEGLTSHLLGLETTYLEAERIAQGAKEMIQIDAVMVKLEEEKNEVQNKLKWKEEQFEYLEEAHNKLQDQFQMTEEDWEREKSVLLKEICSLQSRLNSQTRTVEGLQTRLEMCNNALAHEERKRRSLEIQVSDFESHFQKVSAQFEEETSEIQSLTIESTEETSKLRNAMGTKEKIAKEMELKIAHLEQENQELIGSLKELQKDQIKNAGSGSSAKLHNKLRRLEQVHSSCSAKLKEKESELISQVEKIEKDASSFKYDLEGKEEDIKKLQMELESCNCTIQELNEEISIILEVLKSELLEAYSTTYNGKAEMKLFDKEKDDKISLLTAQLEMSCSVLETARLELEEERKKDRKLEDLLQQIVVLEGKLVAKAYEMEAGVEAKENLAQIAKEKEICMENLQNDDAMLEQEFRRKEFEAATLARFDTERDFTEEKERLLRVIIDKEQRLKVLATSLESDLTSSVISSFSDAIEKQVKIDALNEAMEKHKYATDLEIEEKIKLITHLEKEVRGLHQSLTQQEKYISSLKQEVEQLQASVESKILEINKSTDEKRKMEGTLKQLESDKGRLLQENLKLSVERESLLAYLQKVCDSIGEFSTKDVEMMGTLGKLLPMSEEKVEPAMDLMVHEFHDPIGENAGTNFSTTTMKFEAPDNERSPLKEVNLWQR